MTALPRIGQKISAPFPSVHQIYAHWELGDVRLSFMIYVPIRLIACTVAGLACSSPTAFSEAFPKARSSSPLESSSVHQLERQQRLQRTRLAVQIKHYAQSHQKEDTSKFVGVGRDGGIVRGQEVVAIEHRSWNDLIPVWISRCRGEDCKLTSN